MRIRPCRSSETDISLEQIRKKYKPGTLYFKGLKGDFNPFYKVFSMTSQSRLKLPPFGKILLAYQEQRVRLNFSIYIHLGKDADQYCFTDIRNGDVASYLPMDTNFMDYQWPIAGQKVVLVDHGGIDSSLAKKILIKFKSFKPRLIYFWSDPDIDQNLFIKENYRD